MANVFYYIQNTKDEILNQLVKDSNFIDVLGVTEEELENDIMYKRLFPFNYIYDGVLNDVKSYVCLEIEIPEVMNKNIFADCQIIFHIICHQDDMKLNITGLNGTRVDNLARIISEKYNNKSGFGFKRLQLMSNTSSSINEVFRYRQLIFTGSNLNLEICGEYE